MTTINERALLDSLADRLQMHCDGCDAWMQTYIPASCPVSCTTAQIWFRTLREYDLLRRQERLLVRETEAYLHNPDG